MITYLMYAGSVITFAYILHLGGAEFFKSVFQIVAYSTFMLFILCHHFWTYNKAYAKHQKAKLAFTQCKTVLDLLPTGVAILNLSTVENPSPSSIMYHNTALTQITSKWDKSGQILECKEPNSE
jgi:hypothetical protein